MSKAAIILAAGQGTRMKSSLPKVLHKVAGLPLLGHVITALRGAGVERIVVVTSAAVEALKDFSGTLVIVNGDMPLVTADTISECLTAQARTGLALLAFEPADAG